MKLSGKVLGNGEGDIFLWTRPHAKWRIGSIERPSRGAWIKTGPQKRCLGQFVCPMNGLLVCPGKTRRRLANPR
eukprot:127689-Prorocentrum_lima.AAC.1